MGFLEHMQSNEKTNLIILKVGLRTLDGLKVFNITVKKKIKKKKIKEKINLNILVILKMKNFMDLGKLKNKIMNILVIGKMENNMDLEKLNINKKIMNILVFGKKDKFMDKESIKIKFENIWIL